MPLRYEYRTIRTGVDVEGKPEEFVDIVEVLNMQPDREQFRALVRVITLAELQLTEDDFVPVPGIHFEDVPLKWSDEAIAAMDAEPGVFGQEEE